MGNDTQLIQHAQTKDKGSSSDGETTLGVARGGAQFRAEHRAETIDLSPWMKHEEGDGWTITGVGSYRGQNFTKSLVISGGVVVPLDEHSLKAQRAAIDANLDGHFSAKEVKELEELAKNSIALRNLTEVPKLAEFETRYLTRIHRDLSDMSHRESPYSSRLSAVSEYEGYFSEISKSALLSRVKPALEAVAAELGRIHQKGRRLSHGEDVSEADMEQSYAMLWTVKEKISEALRLNAERMERIVAVAALRANPLLGAEQTKVGAECSKEIALSMVIAKQVELITIRTTGPGGYVIQ